MNKINFFLFFLPFLSFSQDPVKSSNFFDNLTAEEKRIIIMKGTERPGSGLYNKYFEKGIYICKACNNQLFNSNAKFQSNCGWPSFDEEINGSIVRHQDSSFGMKRTEICCANCNGHLGHVFEGEELTERNIRYCVNSLSMKFVNDKNMIIHE